ncbi:MAG: family 20 glycosylhydrolase [Bacteroidaceae bacterium]|nr:family 20 glycosylhydrolase [Bacteroidaceae bacterium]
MKRHIALLCTVWLTLLPHWLRASPENLLPKPKVMHISEGKGFAMGKTVRLYDPTDCPMLRSFLLENGCNIETMRSAKKAIVTVKLMSEIPGCKDYELAGFANEGYRLEVTKDDIRIQVLSPIGVFRAAATLMQLAEDTGGHLPAVEITDWPAFKLRGYMHDVGRSFLSVEELKHEIDLLSRFKINCFHWHLTENQAWRFEVKAFPQLTSSESMTRLPGKYYTQEQCREVMRYAAERGMAVIPEIDMPGHSQAFHRAMGFPMQTDEGVEALKTILEEAVSVFDGAPYIHIGGDEQDFSYPNFLRIVTDKVHELGQRVVIWNPIHAELTAETGADMTQMWSTAGKAVKGLPNIDCRYNYTNHFDVFADLVGIYNSNIYYAQEGNPDLAGSISAGWNDRNLPTERDILLQNNFWANLLATAERSWMGGGERYIEQGGVMLPNEGETFDDFCDFERRLLHHKDGVLRNEPIPYVRQTNVRWRVEDGLGQQHVVTGAGIYLRHVWGNTVPALFSDAQIGSSAKAWTWVWSPKEQEAGALIEFQNYSRSEKDLAPDIGNWDRKGSRIWLNGEEILPPNWQNAGREITNETWLLDENFTARGPVLIRLKKGWNPVEVHLPYEKAPGVRLNKWMWTFVITTTDGRHALDGIVYDCSAERPRACD